MLVGTESKNALISFGYFVNPFVIPSSIHDFSRP